MSDVTGIDAGHWSRIENGTRPPTENVAIAADHAFPERDGWFSEYYNDSRSWMQPGFRNWAELEMNASHLSVWCPSILHGLLHTEGYARALMELDPALTADEIDVRLAARMARQQRVLNRDDAPAARFVVDEAALSRQVGSPATMVDQLNRLLALAAMPRVTVQLLPNTGHAATSAELILTDDAAYTEHLAAGGVYTGDAFTKLETLFGTIAAECFRQSETESMIREAIERWTNNSK
jgi:hypothetical protein